jgi:hypothetical protein
MIKEAARHVLHHPVRRHLGRGAHQPTADGY